VLLRAYRRQPHGPASGTPKEPRGPEVRSPKLEIVTKAGSGRASPINQTVWINVTATTVAYGGLLGRQITHDAARHSRRGRVRHRPVLGLCPQVLEDVGDGGAHVELEVEGALALGMLDVVVQPYEHGRQVLYDEGVAVEECRQLRRGAGRPAPPEGAAPGGWMRPRKTEQEGTRYVGNASGQVRGAMRMGAVMQGASSVGNLPGSVRDLREAR
jgi:hypothetical protein